MAKTHMHKIVHPQLLKPRAKLLQEFACNCLRHSLVVPDVACQVAPTTVLHDKVESVLGLHMERCWDNDWNFCSLSTRVLGDRQAKQPWRPTTNASRKQLFSSSASVLQ